MTNKTIRTNAIGQELTDVKGGTIVKEDNCDKSISYRAVCDIPDYHFTDKKEAETYLKKLIDTASEINDG